MKKYIRTEKNVVVEVMETSEDIKDAFHPSLKWELCSNPAVQQGWVYQSGTWQAPSNTTSSESLIEEERIWRDVELIRADYELNKVQDGDAKAKGTVGAWRDYRKLLRNLPEAEGFPVSHVRPVAPDSV